MGKNTFSVWIKEKPTSKLIYELPDFLMQDWGIRHMFSFDRVNPLEFFYDTIAKDIRTELTYGHRVMEEEFFYSRGTRLFSFEAGTYDVKRILEMVYKFGEEHNVKMIYTAWNEKLASVIKPYRMRVPVDYDTWANPENLTNVRTELNDLANVANYIKSLSEENSLPVYILDYSKSTLVSDAIMTEITKDIAETFSEQFKIKSLYEKAPEPCILWEGDNIWFYTVQGQKENEWLIDYDKRLRYRPITRKFESFSQEVVIEELKLFLTPDEWAEMEKAFSGAIFNARLENKAAKDYSVFRPGESNIQDFLNEQDKVEKES